MGRRREWTAKERQKVHDHYGRDAPFPRPSHDLAAELGVSPAQLNRAASRYGCTRVKRRYREYAALILAALDAGKSVKDVARELNVPYGTLKMWARRVRAEARGGNAHGDEGPEV